MILNSPDFIPLLFQPLTVLYPIPPPFSHLQEGDTRKLYPSSPSNSLLPHVSLWRGASWLTEPRPGSPLLYMYWKPHISWCMLPGLWLSVWERSGVHVNWDYRFSIGFLSSSVSSSLSLVQLMGSWIYFHCLWIFQSLGGSFEGQPWKAPFFEHNST